MQHISFCRHSARLLRPFGDFATRNFCLDWNRFSNHQLYPPNQVLVRHCWCCRRRNPFPTHHLADFGLAFLPLYLIHLCPQNIFPRSFIVGQFDLVQLKPILTVAPHLAAHLFIAIAMVASA
jgi:hypothetical protein